MTINRLPTEYLREMLVLANEMFDSPPVFAWVLPVFVRLRVTVTCWFEKGDLINVLLCVAHRHVHE